MFLVYREGTPSLAQAGYSKDRRELALAESKLPCHHHAPGAILASNRSDSISSLDSWSGCRPLGTSTTDNETFPLSRAASCWLPPRPASIQHQDQPGKALHQ